MKAKPAIMTRTFVRSYRRFEQAVLLRHPASRIKERPVLVMDLYLF